MSCWYAILIWSQILFSSSDTRSASVKRPTRVLDVFENWAVDALNFVVCLQQEFPSARARHLKD
jgi:hypothetical protein